MSSLEANPSLSEKLIFKPFINYESIICAHFPNSGDSDDLGTPVTKINAACIGVHFTSTDEVYIHAYEDTHTRLILKIGTRFAINFSENFYEYAVAALRRNNHEKYVDELPRTAFLTTDPVPILKSSWAAVICEVIDMPREIINRPVCRRRENPNIRAKILSKNVYRLPVLFNNRSMNLAIESLILATRIPIYGTTSTDYRQAIKTYVTIKKKIIAWRDMERFHDAYILMDNFLIDGGVPPQELSFL
ncbi:MAG: DUF447 domain-containing protein [Promethearchaeota archaeon]